VNYKKYIINFISIIVIVITVIVGFNWVVDPYGINDAPLIQDLNATKLEISTHMRMVKANNITKMKPQAIILGTSHAYGGIDANYQGWSYSPVYNLGLPMANMYEMTRYLQSANAINPIKQVVVLLDLFSFCTPQTNAPDFKEEYLTVTFDGKYQPDYFTLSNNLSNALSIDTLNSSIKTILNQPNSLTSNANTKKNYHAVFLAQEKGVRDWNYLPELYPSWDSISNNSPLFYYRKFLQICYHNNIELFMAISPSHVHNMEVIYNAGLWTRFEEWKQQLVEINEEESLNAGCTPFPLWDFETYNVYTEEEVPPKGDISTQMQWHVDSDHFSKKLGTLVLARMFGDEEGNNLDFGEMVNSTNINQHLLQIRLDQQIYRMSHIDDISEIKSLFSNKIK